MSAKGLYVCIAVAFLLTGCGVMPVVPRRNPDIFNGYKVIQGFQKKDSIGHTDPVQREEDLRECGVINFFDGTLDLSVDYGGGVEQVKERMANIGDCMELKGYLNVDPVNCTRKGKPTGFCN